MKKHICISAIVSIFTVNTMCAASVAFVGGDTESGLFTGDPGNTVVDMGYLVPTINSTNPVLFETGGDGIGFMLAQVGTDLRVFQDQNSGAETALSLDISAFAGQVVSIRLSGNFSLADGSRSIELDVIPSLGSAISVSDNSITSADDRLSGSDGTGFGGINGSLAGNGEAGSGVQSFDTVDRDIAGPGSSVLDADQLVGVIYSAADANSQRALAIPNPGTWGLVSTVPIPEPSSALLLLLGSLSLITRRRRS